MLKNVQVPRKRASCITSALLAGIKVNFENRLAWQTVGLTPKWYTFHFKPVRKLWQYVLNFLIVKWLVHIPPACENGSFINDDSTQLAKLIDINSEKF